MHKRENMAANISGGRDETGESALRRSFKAWTYSSKDLISALMVCSKRFVWLEFIAKWNWCQSRRVHEGVGSAGPTT